MDATTWIFIAIAVVVLLIVIGLLMARQRRESTMELRDRFGPEYDRTVEERGSEKEARQHLGDVRDRREELDIRSLEPAARDRYQQRWDVVQSEFVDRPGPAVDQADSIVTDVMRERGYPVDDFDTRADMMAADHPHVVEDYRQATDARRRYHDSGADASTEELRRAMVHYRSLFERLLGDSNPDGDPDTRDQDLGRDQGLGDAETGEDSESTGRHAR